MALVADGGRGWIAGVIYLHNLIRALHLLPPAERPAVHLLLGLGERPEDHREVGPQLASVQRFACRPGPPLWRQPRAVAASLASGAWPRTLASAAERVGADLLFPALGSLGGDFPVAWIGWIADLQHRVLPEHFSEAERGQRDERFDRLVRESPCLVLSSQAARRDLLRNWEVKSARLCVLPFPTVPADSWFAADAGLSGLEARVPEKFLIFPSQWWVHKNHTILFTALRILRDRGLDVRLVLTGLESDYRHPGHADRLIRELDHDQLADRVTRLGLLPRGVQIQLLRRAAAVVQPSLFEGWSALVEDARVLAKRIFVSDIAVHREQSPPRAVWFDPRDPERLADRIAEEWPHLVPGPDEDKECQAWEAGRMRALTFARAFLDIAAHPGSAGDTAA